jgi:hypothetical protein
MCQRSHPGEPGPCCCTAGAFRETGRLSIGATADLARHMLAVPGCGHIALCNSTQPNTPSDPRPGCELEGDSAKEQPRYFELGGRCMSHNNLCQAAVTWWSSLSSSNVSSLRMGHLGQSMCSLTVNLIEHAGKRGVMTHIPGVCCCCLQERHYCRPLGASG